MAQLDYARDYATGSVAELLASGFWPARLHKRTGRPQRRKRGTLTILRGVVDVNDLDDICL